jgi:hypothetical protein
MNGKPSSLPRCAIVFLIGVVIQRRHRRNGKPRAAVTRSIGE